MAVLSWYDTVTLATPGTASRLFLTTNGQVAQYIFFTASVTVRSAPNTGADASTQNPRRRGANDLLMDFLHSRKKQRPKEVEADRGHNQESRSDERDGNKSIGQRTSACVALGAGLCRVTVR